MKRLALPLLVTGCNQVFGIEPTGVAPISDAAINCATMPGDPAFHDEDDDDYADVCDNCVGTPNQAQTDTDGDAIGDACDPQPGKLDKILAAFTFTDPSTSTLWRPVLGRWTVESDALVSSDTNNESEHDVLYTAERWGAPIALETRITFDELAPTAVEYKFGIEALVETDGEGAFECFVGRAPNQAPNDRVRSWGLGQATSALVDSQLGPGASYRLQLTFDGSSVQCRVEGAAGDGGSASHVTTDFVPRVDHVGAFTQAVAGRVHYLVVYELAP